MAGWPPAKNSAFTWFFFLRDADGDLVSGASALDVEVSGDGAVFADVAGTEVDEGEGLYSCPITAGEMNFDVVALICKTGTAGAKTPAQVVYTSTRQLDDLAFPTTSGRSIDVAATGEVGLDYGNTLGTIGNADADWVDGSNRVDVGQFLGNVVVISSGLPDVNIAAQDNIDFGATQKASINTEIDTALNTAIPGGPTANSINERILAIDDLTQGAGAGDLAAILGDTNELQGDDVPGLIAALNDPTIAAIADGVWDEARSGHVAAGSFGEGVATVQGNVTGSVASVTGNVAGDVQGNVDGSVASIGVGGIIDGAIAAAELINIADGCLDRRLDLGTDTGGNTTTSRTWRDALRVLRNRVAIAAGTMTVFEEDDSTTAWTAAVTTASGDPISELNPS